MNTFASGLQEPRWLAIARNGDVFVTKSASGRISLLCDSDGGGATDFYLVYLSGLNQPHGLDFHGGYLYIAEVSQIRRIRYVQEDLEVSEPIETAEFGFLAARL